MKEWEIFHDGMMPAPAAYALALAAFAILAFCLVQELRRRSSTLLKLLWITRTTLAVLAAVFLARPNLLLKTHRVQTGKTVVMIDDSASMFVRQNAAGGPDAHQIAALIGLEAETPHTSEYKSAEATLAYAAAALSDLEKPARKASDDLDMGIPLNANDLATIKRARQMTENAAERLEHLAGSIVLQESWGVMAATAARQLRALAEQAASLSSSATYRPTVAEWRALAGGCVRAVASLDAVKTAVAEIRENAGMTSPPAENLAAEISGLAPYEIAWKVASKAPLLKGCDIMNLSSGSRLPVAESEAIGYTDIVNPLGAWLEERPLELINGVVLFTDGGQNLAYDSTRLEIYRRRRIPLILVGMGSSEGSNTLTISDVQSPLFGNLRDPAEIIFEVRSELPAGTPVELLLDSEHPPVANIANSASEAQAERRRAKPAQQRGSPLPWRSVLPSPESKVQIWRVPVRWDVAGRHILKITASGGGATCERRVFVHVFERKPSVLLIADAPDPFVTSVLAQRRQNIAVYPLITYRNPANCRRGEARQSLPRSPKEWSRYDLIILCGKPFPGFSSEDVQGITAAVREKGVSLVLVGDLASGYGKALSNAFAWSWPETTALDPSPRIAPAAEAGHLPMLNLAGDVVRSMNVWREMAGPSGWQSVPDGDFVLVRHDPSGHPVVSMTFQECGRVLLVGLDGWQNMKEWGPEAFDRFVGRLVQDMLLPVFPSDDGPASGAYPPIGEPGGKSILSARSAEISAEKINASIAVSGSAESLILEMKKDGNCFRTRHIFSRPGRYSIVPAGAPPIAYEVSQPPSAELRETGLDEETLRELASASGGSFVPISRFSTEAASVLAPREREIIQSRAIRFESLRGAAAAVFILVAAADFIIRKHSGLAV